MKRSRIREMSMEVTVGFFMFMILLALGLFTIILSRENFLQESYPIHVRFQNVMGLREGDNVFVRGVSVGKIKSLQVKEDGVYLTANLDIPVTIHKDYKVEILPTSMLGGRHLNIDEGSDDQPLVDLEKVLRGTPPIDLIDEASRTITMVKEALDEGGVLENLEATMQQLRDVSTRLSSGEGTMGKLLTDDQLYYDLQEISSNLAQLSRKLNQGEGTLSKLLTDDAMYNDLSEVSANLKTISARLAEGKGTLGRLMAEDDQMYEDLSAAAASLRQVGEKISEGQGTVGKLVQDDELYEEMKLLLNELRATVDDLRETSPITTFTTVFFGAF
jgi:phospholipid/cholesterol/gamma-HCH transport system substrate-binding protein